MCHRGWRGTESTEPDASGGPADNAVEVSRETIVERSTIPQSGTGAQRRSARYYVTMDSLIYLGILLLAVAVLVPLIRGADDADADYQVRRLEQARRRAGR